MLNAQVLVTASFCARGAVCRLSLATCLAASGVLIDGGGAFAASPGKSYFFATRDACVAAGVFLKRECDAAFANAGAELRDRAPRFSTGEDCRLRFHMCEMRRFAPQDGADSEGVEADPVAYVPSALGVEMVASAKSVEAAPVLAVETPPSLFPKVSVARVYEPREREAPRQEASENSAILPADRFEPFKKRKPSDGAPTFNAYALGALGDGQRLDASASVASQESPQERRARLKNAPFIE